MPESFPILLHSQCWRRCPCGWWSRQRFPVLGSCYLTCVGLITHLISGVINHQAGMTGLCWSRGQLNRGVLKGSPALLAPLSCSFVSCSWLRGSACPQLRPSCGAGGCHIFFGNNTWITLGCSSKKPLIPVRNGRYMECVLHADILVCSVLGRIAQSRPVIDIQGGLMALKQLKWLILISSLCWWCFRWLRNAGSAHDPALVLDTPLGVWEGRKEPVFFCLSLWRCF